MTKELQPNPLPKQTSLVPLTSDPASPYSQELPVTSGDLNQRILNRLNKKRPFYLRYWAPSTIRKTAAATKITGLLLFSVVLTVYLTNAAVVYKKEQTILELLNKRKELRSRRIELIRNTY